MEGTGRGLLAWAAVTGCAAALVVGVSACGRDEPAALSAAGVATEHPEHAFAPLIQTGYGGDYRPMSADWFIERSTVRTAADGPYAGRRYRDLRDEHRGGPPEPRSPETWRAYDRIPIYYERHDERGGRVRFSYWGLYGMNLPDDRPDQVHEGDWQRVDVVAADLGDSRYEPRALRFQFGRSGPSGTAAHELPWRRVARSERTHPMLISRGGDHVLTAAVGHGCGGCVQWRTWNLMRAARAEPWAGFDGPWGEAGTTAATSGPIGPTASGGG